MSQYITPFIFPSIMGYAEVPFAEKQSQIITLPPPYFTVGFGSYTQSFFLQIICSQRALICQNMCLPISNVHLCASFVSRRVVYEV